MVDGIELLTLHERRGPDGKACLMGFYGGLAVTVTKDKTKGSWTLAIHDLARVSARENDATRARAISAPVDEHGWYQSGDMDDEIPDDLIGSQQPRERR